MKTLVWIAGKRIFVTVGKRSFAVQGAIIFLTGIHRVITVTRRIFRREYGKLINSLAMVAARNRIENIRAASERDTPQIYAALAIALYETLDMPDKDKPEAIATVFAKSQEIWIDCVESGDNMCRLCEELTGIDVVGRMSE